MINTTKIKVGEIFEVDNQMYIIAKNTTTEQTSNLVTGYNIFILDEMETQLEDNEIL